MITLLCLGDVVSAPGTNALVNGGMKRLRDQYKPDLVVVNGENAAEGNGITPDVAEKLYDCGADVITGGNHTWRRREINRMLDEGEYLVRPANYPAEATGMGYVLIRVGDATVLVANLAGCVGMEPLASPFETMQKILQRETGRYQLAVCDFHAEATSEKMALARHFDGKLAAVWGTHTHVATADLQILPGGTGYITDLGMCGSHDGILGVRTDCILHKFLVKTPNQFLPAQGNVQIHGAVFKLDPATGMCTGVEQVNMKV